MLVQSCVMKSSVFLLLITSVSALGCFLFGYDTEVINGAQYFLSQYFDLDPAMKDLVVGSALTGCLVGAISGGYLSMKIGRKSPLIISAILFTISVWGSGLPSFLPESVSLLVMFRIIGGLGIGIASMNAPMSIAVAAQWASNYLVSQFSVVSESETNMINFWNGLFPYFIFYKPHYSFQSKIYTRN